MTDPNPATELLALADWRRRVQAAYTALRNDDRPGPMRVVAFRSARDRLFAEHHASPIPLERRAGFRGLAYWRHAEAFSFRARIEPDPAAPAVGVPSSDEAAGLRFVRIGRVRFTIAGGEHALSIFWLNDYAGGIFIPFRDATSGRETYGGGRYLWDSAKGADLGSGGDELVLDFNYAYHPSCVYDPRWSCPLAPQENWLGVPITAGERLVEEREP